MTVWVAKRTIAHINTYTSIQSQSAIEHWTLPSSSSSTIQTNMSSVELQIVEILEKKLLSIRPESQGDLYNQCGRDVLVKQVQTCLEECRPIQFLLPAFPCKSPNLEKVAGTLPDAAEFYSLDHLNRICQEIDAIHQYGCEFVIWNDGRVFGDLVGVSNEEISTYEDVLQCFSSSMIHLQWDNMTNYVANGDLLIEKYGSSSFDFQQWLHKSENNYQQFIHLRKFMETDSGKRHNRKNLSRRQLQNQMSAVAEQMIKRNEALANLLKSNYPKHIRLSIHQHVNNGEKFTIGLFRENTGQADTQSFLRTPWHNVLVINLDGHKTLLPHKQVHLQSDYLPIMYKDQIWCYVQLPSASRSSTLKLSLLSDSLRCGLSVDLAGQISPAELDVSWMKMLLQIFGIVVFRQCPDSDYEEVFSNRLDSPYSILYCNKTSSEHEAIRSIFVNEHLCPPRMSTSPVRRQMETISLINEEFWERELFDEICQKVETSKRRMLDPRSHIEHIWNENDLVLMENHFSINHSSSLSQSSQVTVRSITLWYHFFLFLFFHTTCTFDDTVRSSMGKKIN